MDASIGHLSALVDELRLLLGCAMDNFNMLHNAAKPDDGPDMDAIIPAIVFAKFVNQDAALRYAIKHSAHDGMITKPAAQRQWAGLTEQEAAECWSTSTVRTWQAIEAKLKEKNNGGPQLRESP
jgi:hypothetical protein